MSSRPSWSKSVLICNQYNKWVRIQIIMDHDLGSWSFTMEPHGSMTTRPIYDQFITLNTHYQIWHPQHSFKFYKPLDWPCLWVGYPTCLWAGWTFLEGSTFRYVYLSICVSGCVCILKVQGSRSLDWSTQSISPKSV